MSKKKTRGTYLTHASYLVIGDVHGCFDELIELLDRYRDDRHVVFVGDLVDKGPRPHRVLELAKTISATVVLGNHEENHIRYANHEEVKRLTGKKNPMNRDDNFKKTHRKLHSSSIDLFAYMETFPHYVGLDEAGPYWEHELHRRDIVVLHGGLLPGVHPEDMDPKQIVRVRSIKPNGKMASLDEVRRVLPNKYKFWTDLYDGDDWVIYGHAPRMNAKISNKTVGIDTACVYGNRLSAIKLPEMEIVSVEAKKTYHTRDSWE